MVDPLQALYYLGVETLEEIEIYVKWLVEQKKPYFGRATKETNKWLIQFLEDKETIIKSFEIMYNEEDNDWREDKPEILKEC